MQYTPQCPDPSSEASPSATPATPPTAPAKRPWLPLRHVIGIIAVVVFVVGGIASGGMLINAREGQMGAEAAALEAANSEDIYAAMTVAMLEDDREGFIHWGKGDARDQLARIWDATKQIGWTVGAVKGTHSDEALSSESLEVTDPDWSPKGDGLRLAFDLGFTQQRYAVGPDGPDSGCVAGSDGCGILTQSFDYDVTVDPGDRNSNSYRIVELSPRTPMPWDDADGIHVVRAENTVVFGYADEAARVDAIAQDAQTAAAGVLQTEVATSGYSDIPGFPAFITDDPDRYRDAVYGAGEHLDEPDREWTEAGVSIISPPLSLDVAPTEAARAYGMLLEVNMFGGQSGSLAAFNGAKIGSDASLRVAAHEFAHALEMTTFSHTIYEDGGGSDTSLSFGSEGYARYVEDVVASPHDGVWRTLDPRVRETVAATSNEGLQGLVGAEAFRGDATQDLAYNAAGNYFAFMADNSVDIAAVMRNGEYMMFDPYTWIGLHYPSSTAGDRVDATPDAWRAWNVR